MKGVTGDVSYKYRVVVVSIHTPNEGSDLTLQSKSRNVQVSIHTPNEGSDITSRLILAG